MTLYQQEMLRKLGRLDCAGRYDEEKGLLLSLIHISLQAELWASRTTRL